MPWSGANRFLGKNLTQASLSINKNVKEKNMWSKVRVLWKSNFLVKDKLQVINWKKWDQNQKHQMVQVFMFLKHGNLIPNGRANFGIIFSLGVILAQDGMAMQGPATAGLPRKRYQCCPKTQTRAVAKSTSSLMNIADMSERTSLAISLPGNSHESACSPVQLQD